MTDTERPSSSASRRTFLAGSAASLGAGLVLGPLSAPASAGGGGSLDSGEDWPDGPGRPNRAQAPDADLRAILAAVDRDRIEATVRKLVSFGTRHTLSTQDDPRPRHRRRT